MFEIITFSFIGILVLSSVGFLGYIAFAIANEAFTKKFFIDAIVINKLDPQTTMTSNVTVYTATGVMTSSSRTSYYVIVKTIDGTEEKINVSNDAYQWISVGDKVEAAYCIGRIDGKRHYEYIRKG